MPKYVLPIDDLDTYFTKDYFIKLYHRCRAAEERSAKRLNTIKWHRARADKLQQVSDRAQFVLASSIADLKELAEGAKKKAAGGSSDYWEGLADGYQRALDLMQDAIAVHSDVWDSEAAARKRVREMERRAEEDRQREHREKVAMRKYKQVMGE